MTDCTFGSIRSKIDCDCEGKTEILMEPKNQISEFLLQMARVGLAGRPQDVQMYVQRVAKKLKASDEETSKALFHLLASNPSRQNPLRGVSNDNAPVNSVPVDIDSRLALLKVETKIEMDFSPIWPSGIHRQLESLVTERRQLQKLMESGLEPTRTVLLHGPPGVGKTMSARWVASQLSIPLLTLELASVMSSFLGKTGSNLKQVLEYAKTFPCVLLLDEFDALAKKRGDETEIGELKRLVTVLLQEIDDWPSTNILMAATNHPELLDPAIWRRFDLNLNFPLPDGNLVEQAVEHYFGPDLHRNKPEFHILVSLLQGESFAAVARLSTKLHKEQVIYDRAWKDCFLNYVTEFSHNLPSKERVQIAKRLMECGWSQRKASEVTGVHRRSLRESPDDEKSDLSNLPSVDNEDVEGTKVLSFN